MCVFLGTNDGEDLPSELLSAIFDRVEKVGLYIVCLYIGNKNRGEQCTVYS